MTLPRLRQGLLVPMAGVLLAAAAPPPPVTNSLPFDEDFEGSVLGRWSLEVDAGNSAAQGFTPWTARRALQAQLGAGAAAPHARLWTGFGGLSQLSVRLYLRVPATSWPLLADGAGVTVVQLDQASVPRIRLQLKKSPDASNRLFLAASWETPAGTTETIGAFTGAPNTVLTPDQWHSVELVYPGGLDTRGVELFIDDPVLPRAASLVGALVPDRQVDAMGVGIGESAGAAGLKLLVDDVRVAAGRSGYGGTPQFHANDYEAQNVGAHQDPPGKDGQLVYVGSTAGGVHVERGQGLGGGQGLVCTDVTDSSLPVQSAAVLGGLVPPATGIVYQRVWWLQTGSASAASPYTLLMLGDSRASTAVPGVGLPLAALRVLPDWRFELWGHSSPGMVNPPTQSTSPFLPGVWHLLEIEAFGLGSGGGGRKAWVDAVPLPLSPATFLGGADQWARGVLSLSSAETGYTGSDVFDEARVSAGPLPSHFVVTPIPGAPLFAGQCGPVMVTALTSGGQPHPVPEAVAVGLSASQGTFHDVPCARAPLPAPVSSVNLAAGQTDAGIYFYPTAVGDVAVGTGERDYVPWTSGLVVQAEVDAGTPDAGMPDAGTPDAGSGPARLALHGLPRLTSPGAQHLVAVQALDGQGRPDPSYRGTVRFSVAGAAGVQLPPDHQFTAEDQGTWSPFTPVSFSAAGTYGVSVSDLNNLATAGQRVEVVPAGQVRILDDQNTRAVAGVPYVYNGAGAVTVVSTTGQPVTFRGCAALPSGFTVDGRSGAVRWTPAMVGTSPICLEAASGAATAQSLYSVTVEPPSSTTVAAGFQLVPDPALPPQPVLHDPVGTAVTTLRRFMRWRFGDGSLPSTLDAPVRRYLLPGGYRPRLTVWDEAGSSARAERPMTVLDGTLVPPTVIVTSKNGYRGQAPFTTELEAAVTQGSSQQILVRWNLGDGRVAYGSKVSVTYGPGRFWPSAVAVDGHGLIGRDKAELVVPQGALEPPECLAAAEPPVVILAAGGQGSTRLQALVAAGSSPVSTVDWEVDGTPFPGALQLIRSYSQPGWHHAVVTVKDGNALRCVDDVWVAVVAPRSGQVGSPPAIVDPGGRSGVCGQPLQAAPLVAMGSGPVQWTVEQGPQELTIDPAGQIVWTPPATPGDVTFGAVATTPWGEDRAQVTLSISCPDTLEFETTACGCGAGGGGLPGLLLLAAEALRRRRRTGRRAR